MLTADSLRARVTPDVWVQLFDRDDDGTVDELSGPDAAALNAAIAAAQSIVAAELSHAYPSGFDASGGTMDAAVTVAAVQIALYEAVRYSPLATGANDSPYRVGYNDAIAMLKRYRTGLEARLTQAASGVGPTFNDGRTGGLVDESGKPRRRFGYSHDNSEGSDF